jgi:hypothetical protein
MVIAADDPGVLKVDQVLLRQRRQLVQYLVGGIFTIEADDDQIAHPSSPLAHAPPIAPDRPTHLVDNIRVEGPRRAEPPPHRCGPSGMLLRLALILRGEAEVSSQSEPDMLAGRRQKARPIRRRAGQLGAGVSTWPTTTPSLHIFISCRTSSYVLTQGKAHAILSPSRPSGHTRGEEAAQADAGIGRAGGPNDAAGSPGRSVD